MGGTKETEQPVPCPSYGVASKTGTTAIQGVPAVVYRQSSCTWKETIIQRGWRH